MPRWAKVSTAVAGGLPALLVTAALVLAWTDFGRERVRRIIQDRASESLRKGSVTIGELSGNLLVRAVLEDVAVAGGEGRPLLSVDELAVEYDPLSFLLGPVELGEVVVSSPTVTVSRPPGGAWNFQGMMPEPTGEFRAPAVHIAEVRVEDGTVVARTPWSPPEDLAAEARDSAVARALGEDYRLRVVEAAGGYQRISELRELDVTLREVGPAAARRVLEGRLASLTVLLLPFERPGLRVRDLTAGLRMSGDSLSLEGFRVALDESRLAGEAVWLREPGRAEAVLAADTFSTADLEWLRPDLPDAGAAFTLTVTGSPEHPRVAAEGVDARIGQARLTGGADVFVGDTVRVSRADFAVEGLRLSLVERLFPGIRIPVAGVVEGRLAGQGTPSRFRIDVEANFQDRRGSRSRVAGRGVLARGPAGYVARDMRLELDPLRLDLAEAVAGDLPLEGLLRGEVVADGSPHTGLTAELDLIHAGLRGTSSVRGDAEVWTGEADSLRLDLHASRIALATVDPLVPGPALRGLASGELRGRGTPRALSFEGKLALEEGGSLDGDGAYDLTGPRPSYELNARLSELDLAAAAAELRPTSLSGTLGLRGRGVGLDSMEARITADVTDPTLDTAGVAALELEAGVADGLATVERAVLRVASARAEARGRFGLVEGRTGELIYTLAVDSLSDFAHRVPADTGFVPARPLEQTRRLARARADSAREARRTEVERAATDGSPGPTLEVDSVPPLPRDSVSGSLRTEGRAWGSVQRFDLTGTAVAEDLLAAGHAVDSAYVRYEWNRAWTDSPTVSLDGHLSKVRVSGWRFDSVTMDLTQQGGYRKGSGKAFLALHQDPERDFRLRVDYDLDLEGANRVTADELALRFGGRRWTDRGEPATVRWRGRERIRVQELSLADGSGGRIEMSLDLPREGPVRGQVLTEGVPVTDVLSVLQDTTRARALFSLEGRLHGTRSDPAFEGDLGLSDVSYRDRKLPDFHTTLDYTGEELRARSELVAPDDRVVARAESRVPLRLAGAGEELFRILDDAPLRVAATIDSLGLDPVPAFVTALANVTGSLHGTVTVSGTPGDPVAEGRLRLGVGTLDAPPLGLELRSVEGEFLIRDSVVIVDSLAAGTGVGTVALQGRIGVEDPAAPSFDLTAWAREGLLLDNDLARLNIDATLDIQGPFDSVAVTGDVGIRGGVLHRPTPRVRQIVELEPAVRSAAIDTSLAAVDVAAGNPLLDNLVVDIELDVSRNTWVRDESANVEVYTPDDTPPFSVHLDRRRGDLVLRGTLQADRGQYIFAGRLLELSSGSVTFVGDPDIDPLVQLTVTHDVPQAGREALVIEINMTGPLEDPRISLTSNAQPPLSQSQLVSLLVVGQASASLVDLSASPLTGSSDEELGALATQQLSSVAMGTLLDDAMSSLHRRGARVGIDVLRISPAQLPRELAFESYLQNVLRGTQVEIGEYVTRRLFVAVLGRFVGAVPGLRLEYRLGGGFSGSATWEPRFIPRLPTLTEDSLADQTRVLGAFLLWKRRF